MLKFDKLLEQVERIGRQAAYRTQEMSERGQRAIEQFQTSTDLAAIHERIDLVRERDAGYRGAAPYEEDIHQAYSPYYPPPEEATLVAVDGSQIYPDLHASSLYYLTNIGVFRFFHGGEGRLPLEESLPELYFAESDLREHNGHGAVIKNAVINFRRDVKEMETLILHCWDYLETDKPLLGVRDGRLLWWLGEDIPQAKELTNRYYDALENFYDLHRRRRALYGQNANLVGYVERSDSSFVIRLLHLLSLEPEQVTRANLETAGDYEGLTDDWLFSRILQPKQRSALMIQQSPQNKAFKFELGEAFEITFFYINVGTWGQPHIIRVEVPMWVAEAEGAVDEVHQLLLDQIAITGKYPYVLTRADELAVVSSYEKRQLEDLITIELLRNAQNPEKSSKQQSKDQVRGKRGRYKEAKGKA